MDAFIQSEENRLVSVVMASFNGERFIAKQIKSVLSQSYTELELIIVDDGSSDQTADIVKEFLTQDERVYFFPSGKNLGLVKNFERGLKLSKGEFIVFADQDDIFQEDKIEKQLAALNNNLKADMVISDLELIDDADNRLFESMWQFQGICPEKKAPFKRLCVDNYATGCAMMFSRKLLDSTFSFPSHLKIHDQWLALLAARKNGGGIEVIREPLTRYRQHQDNVVGAKSSKQLDWFNVFSKIFSLEGLKVYHQNTVQLISDKRLRVLSFLERSDLFSGQEIAYLRLLESTLATYLPDTEKRLINRIAFLPRAFYLSYFSRNFWRMSVRFLILSIFPTKNPEKNKYDQTT